MYFSDCCGCPMDGIEVDYGICPLCHEHCAPENDEPEELVEEEKAEEAK